MNNYQRLTPINVLNSFIVAFTLLYTVKMHLAHEICGRDKFEERLFFQSCKEERCDAFHYCLPHPEITPVCISKRQFNKIEFFAVFNEKRGITIVIIIINF